MCRPIFTEADGVVSQNINRWDFGDGGQTHRRTHVVSEVEKSPAKGTEFDHRHAVQRGSHGVFADTEMNIAPTVVLRTEHACAIEFQISFVRSCQIRSSPDQPWNILRYHIQHLTGTFARGYTFCVCREGWKVFIPA